ncbi:hypothetical protein QZH41_004617 [Actinostola sp. cb2023]|nr:hypothetical protein QZH41_004617 [Actinostola sp. cb2023]
MASNKAKRKTRNSSETSKSASQSPLDKKNRNDTEPAEDEVFLALDMAQEVSSNMKKILEKLEKLDTLENVMDKAAGKIDSIENQFTHLGKKMDSLETKQLGTEEAIKELNAASEKMADEKEHMWDRLNHFEDDLFAAKQRASYLEAYSKRENLILMGIPIDTQEGQENTEEIIRALFTDKLNMTNVEEIEFQRLHRFGRPKNGSRPVIARFLRYKDVIKVLQNTFRLKGSSISIFQDFPKEIQDSRKRQLQKLKKAKDEGKSAYFSKSKPDKLYIEVIVNETSILVMNQAVSKSWNAIHFILQVFGQHKPSYFLQYWYSGHRTTCTDHDGAKLGKGGLYRRLNQSERLRATGNSSKAKNKVRTTETKAFEFCLLNSVDDEEDDGEQTLVKENIIERGIIMLSESDSEVEIRKKIVSSLREKYPIFGASDFEFVKVTQKKISILNLAKGMEYNYGVVKKLVGQGNLYVQIKRGFQFVLESEEEEEKEEEKEILTSSFSLSSSLKEKDKGANPSQGSTTCIQPQDNLQQVKDGQENAFSALSNDMPSNITDPTEMLRYLQKKIVNGRALEVIDPSVVMEGETNFIAVDRDNIIETTFDEIKGIKDPSITFKVQFYGEIAVDSGGPRKEWIRLFNQDTKQKYFDHGLKEHLAEDYFYIGQMAAIALLQNGQIPRYFPEECLQDIFVNEKNSSECIVQVQKGMDTLGIHMFPKFSEPGSNSRMYENQVYSKFIKYVREVSSGRRVTTLANILECVTCANIYTHQVKADCEKFYRRLRLKAHFHGQDNEPTDDPFAKFNNKISTWTPPQGEFSAIDYYIDRCRRIVNSINFKRPVKVTNLTEEEKTALKHLRQRKDIVIKPADKGGAVVVWSRPLYIQEANRQLSDARFYQHLSHDPLKEYQKTIKSVVNEMIANVELPPSAKHLIVTSARTSRFYLLPKIHKPNNPGRPIVSACNCPTQDISAFLDEIMAPFVKSLPSYVKDTNDALNIFDAFRFNSNNSNTAGRFLFTMDIKSLYTVIPNDGGLQALTYYLDQRLVKEPPTHTLTRLAELVLTLNAFSFNGQIYHQTGGVAMGTKMGPNYACLYVGYFEDQVFRQYTGFVPQLYRRYIDDVIGAASCNREELEGFIDFVSNFNPALQFTYTITERELPFLDITLRIDHDRLQTSVFYKETATHNYLHYNSSHPSHCKRSIPYSQFLRLRRLCSDNNDFLARSTEMKTFFIHRGYLSSSLDDDLRKIMSIDRQDALVPRQSVNNETQERVPLVLTYHPLTTNIKRILLENFTILSNDPLTKILIQSSFGPSVNIFLTIGLEDHFDLLLTIVQIMVRHNCESFKLIMDISRFPAKIRSLATSEAVNVSEAIEK